MEHTVILKRITGPHIYTADGKTPMPSAIEIQFLRDGCRVDGRCYTLLDAQLMYLRIDEWIESGIITYGR